MIFQILLKNRNLQLLVILLAFLLVLPFVNLTRAGGIILTVFMSLILFFAVLASGNAKHVSKTSIVLGGIALSCFWAEYFHRHPITVWIGTIMFCIFFLYIAIVMISKIITIDEISTNTIYGAACVYIIFGFFWAFIFSLIEYHTPGAFHFPGELKTDSIEGIELNLFECLYFSFVTITTLGYGDITPVSKFAKMLVVIEGVCGQLYITILLARLVGLYTAKESRDLIHESEQNG